MGPALGMAPARAVGVLSSRTSRRQSPTSTHARCRAGNGEERGRTLRARNPATLPLKSPQQAAWHSPRLSQGPMATSPPRKSHSESFVGQTWGPALGTAPARSPWGFLHHGTSRRQSPTSAHASCRAGNREERGRTLRARNPATLPLKSPQQAAWRSPRLSQGPMATSPPRKSHRESFVGRTWGPALGTVPARGPWGFLHHGTSRRQSPTSAHAGCRAGNGEERGQTLRARNPTTLPLKSPQQAAWRPPCLSQGPMVCYRHRPLPTGRGSYRTTRSVLAPHSMLTYWEGRRDASSPPVFKALCGVPRPAPRVTLAGGRAQNGQNFGLTLNIGPAFSDRFQVLTAI